MNILLTGATGFIGHYVVEQLLKEDNICIFGTGRQEIVSPVNYTYINIDISEQNCVKKLVGMIPRCNAIIHLAASLDMNDGYSAIRTNCIGTYNMCRLANEWKSSKLIYMSSLPVIGVPECTPITEDHNVKPRTIYHVSKFAGEQIVNVSCIENMKRSIVRISSPIGFGMNENNFLSIVLRNCLENKDILVYGKGQRHQNYVDVRDIAKGIRNLLFSGAYGLFNIAGQKTISNIKLVQLCKQITNSKSHIIFANKEDAEENFIWDISIEKATNSFGYFTQYSLEDTISWIYESMRLK